MLTCEALPCSKLVALRSASERDDARKAEKEEGKPHLWWRQAEVGGGDAPSCPLYAHAAGGAR